MDYDKVEQEVAKMINAVRANPKVLIPELEGMLGCFKNKYFKIPGTNINIITQEGVGAVNNAIEFLNNQKALPEYQESRGLYLAAKDHVNDIGPHGLASHEGTDGSRMCDRIEKYGEWQISIAENIGFDDSNPRDIVLNMIIDDGNKSRGHRKNIFSEDFRSFGIACGRHRDYKHVTVANFAVSYKDKPELLETKKESIPEEPLEVYRRKTTIPVDLQRESDVFQHNNVNESISFKKDTMTTQKENEPKHKMSELEMPEGAVSCKVKKFIKTVGNKRTTKVIRTYIMADGSTEVLEEIDEEYI